MKLMFKKIFLLLTNSIARKNDDIKKFFLRKEQEEKWQSFFNGKSEIVFPLSEFIRINLQRNSKLSEYILFFNFEKTETEFISKFVQQGDLILDIGANIGLHALYASVAAGSSGRIYSFEPTPSTFKKLQDNIALNNFKNITAINIGLSEKEDKLKLQTSTDYDAWNSFAKEEITDNGLFDAEVEVDVLTMDSWLKNNVEQPQKISFIKIDVEGWEKFVVAGGSSFFNDFAPLLLIEFDDSNAHRAGYHAVEVYDLLQQFGFCLYAMEGDSWVPAHRMLHYPSQNLIALKVQSEFGNRFKEMFLKN